MLDCEAVIQVSLSLEAPNYCLCIQSNSAGFSFVNTGKHVQFKALQTAFRTEFGERLAPSKCCIQILVNPLNAELNPICHMLALLAAQHILHVSRIRVKKLETRGSRSNARRLLSLGPIEGQSVQKYTSHTRTTQRRHTPRDSSRQSRHFGKSIPEFGETHSSVLRCERRPVSASIMSRSYCASFPVCVYKFSSHYLNNIIFYRQ